MQYKREWAGVASAGGMACITAGLACVVVAVSAASADPSAARLVEEDRADPAQVLIVSGDNAHSLAARQARVDANRTVAFAEVPEGGPEAALKGKFGPVIGWPSVPIHMTLTPDGRVMNFGATSTGKQGGDRDYAVWDPKLGIAPEAFLLLPNTTEVNIFCAGQWLMPTTGTVLLSGGTEIRPPVRGIGISNTTLFSPKKNTITNTTPMTFRRWYATTIGNLDGEVVALGGRIDPTDITGGKVTAASTPEAYNPITKSWRTLWNAQSDTAYGIKSNAWFYPRAWLAPSGDLFIVAHEGSMFSLSTAGAGELRQFASRTTPENAHMPAAMYAPGKIISVRDGRQVTLIDINGPTPVVTAGTPISRHRRYGNATVLPNGNVWVNGGVDAEDNILEGAHFASEMWNPQTGQWSETAAASIARLYHSNAVLLPDATVLTGGGGLPGPLTNMNAEIYYPPYLYEPDGSGRLAVRPTLDTTAVALTWGQTMQVKFTSAKPITRVTLVGVSQATHAFNPGQRFLELSFSPKPAKLQVTLPASRTLAPPGYYLMFAINSEGVPSTGKMIRLLDQGAPARPQE
jgi:Domain of unknown function (DUF1929)